MFNACYAIGLVPASRTFGGILSSEFNSRSKTVHLCDTKFFDTASLKGRLRSCYMRIRAKGPGKEPKTKSFGPWYCLKGSILLFSSHWRRTELGDRAGQQAFTLTRRFLLHRGWVVKLKSESILRHG